MTDSKLPYIIIGGVLLFGGSTVGTYLATRSSGPARPAYSQEQSQTQTAPIDSPAAAVQAIENREQERRNAADQEKRDLYNKRKKACGEALSKVVSARININDRLEAEAGNYVLSILGMDQPLQYSTLDTNDPATRLFAYDAAIGMHDKANRRFFDKISLGYRRFDETVMGDLHRLSLEIGENLPSEENLKEAYAKLKDEFIRACGLPANHYVAKIRARMEKIGGTERRNPLNVDSWLLHYSALYGNNYELMYDYGHFYSPYDGGSVGGFFSTANHDVKTDDWVLMEAEPRIRDSRAKEHYQLIRYFQPAPAQVTEVLRKRELFDKIKK